jgi:hypothetical protein
MARYSSKDSEALFLRHKAIHFWLSVGFVAVGLWKATASVRLLAGGIVVGTPVENFVVHLALWMPVCLAVEAAVLSRLRGPVYLSLWILTCWWLWTGVRDVYLFTWAGEAVSLSPAIAQSVISLVCAIYLIASAVTKYASGGDTDKPIRSPIIVLLLVSPLVALQVSNGFEAVEGLFGDLALAMFYGLVFIAIGAYEGIAATKW